jgi:hypothetical protein
MAVAVGSEQQAVNSEQKANKLNGNFLESDCWKLMDYKSPDFCRGYFAFSAFSCTFYLLPFAFYLSPLPFRLLPFSFYLSLFKF